ncbi:MAG TPA: tetratricopeptide repeat protein [Candidatus Nanoarchaeia archaeon]|nr:tetratricopeptide repeat protein [Candidatus Nanoarchaeia archaeon]
MAFEAVVDKLIGRMAWQRYLLPTDKQKVYQTFGLMQSEDPDCRTLEKLVNDKHPDARRRFNAARVLTVYEKLFREYEREFGPQVSLALTSAFHAALFYENKDQFAPIVAEGGRGNGLFVATYSHATSDILMLAQNPQWVFKSEFFCLAVDYARFAYELDQGQQTTAKLVWALGGLAQISDRENAVRLFQEAVNAYERAYGDELPMTPRATHDIARCYHQLGNLTENRAYLEKADQMLRTIIPNRPERDTRLSDRPF